MEPDHIKLMVEKESGLKQQGRILFFLSSFQIGGAHLQMTYLIEELKNAGYEIFICTHMNDGGGLNDRYRKLNVPIFNLSRKHKLDLSIVSKLKTVLVEQSIDVIVLFQPQNYIYFRMAQRSMDRRVKQVGLLRAMGIWLGHKNYAFRLIDDAIVKSLIRTSDLVVANSRAIKKKYDALFHLPDTLINVIPNVSDFDFATTKTRDEIRKELGFKADDIIVIMVARLDPWKDFETLMRAALVVHEKKSDIKFVLCGGGKLETALQKQIYSLKLESSVFLIGEKKNARCYVNAADISVLTTKGEGFSNSIMEAMFLEKPVIATDVGGNGELLGRDRTAGYLVPPKNAEALSQIILELAGNAELRHKTGINGKLRVMNLCNRKNNMEKMKGLFDSLFQISSTAR